MRLVNGRTRNEGIVEVCLNGVWSTIKSYGWNTPDAEVVCRQLGMSWECESYHSHHFVYMYIMFKNFLVIKEHLQYV